LAILPGAVPANKYSRTGILLFIKITGFIWFEAYIRISYSKMAGELQFRHFYLVDLSIPVYTCPYLAEAPTRHLPDRATQR
jgi:hypothetical protein